MSMEDRVAVTQEGTTPRQFLETAYEDAGMYETLAILRELGASDFEEAAFAAIAAAHRAGRIEGMLEAKGIAEEHADQSDDILVSRRINETARAIATAIGEAVEGMKQ